MYLVSEGVSDNCAEVGKLITKRNGYQLLA
jgi:hypothetical protein